MLYKYVIVFDHFKNELTLVELLQDGEASNLMEIESVLDNRNFASYNFQTNGPETSSITDEEYKAMVREGVSHCLRGDVFQIVLSRRFEQPFKGDDFKVYRALRSINPSPYLFYFDFGGFRIFGSSPETHCKVSDGHGNESPEDCRALYQLGFPLIKAFSIASASDLSRTEAYEDCVDYFLFDTKCSGFGGSGRQFDWSLLSAYKGRTPFLLSGGITPSSAESILQFKHPAFAGIDLNSGFETSPAIKNVQQLKEFVELIRKK